MKKFLSLVLALVMTMSLVTISAGATEYKDFTDKDEIQYAEAVTVLNKLGIITGYSEGDFRPEGELTRGAAAKILVSLLIGPDAANALGNESSPYPDVPAGNTFAGVISYCKTAGLISGYGDGTFRPQGTLTGYAFSKMLLGALGYKSEYEGFTGSGWNMNVARLGGEAGLFDRISFNGNATVTREQACQLALNTIKGTMVEYSGGMNITNGGQSIVVNPDRDYKTSNQEFATHINNKKASEVTVSANTPYTVEFGEEHFVDLRMSKNETEAADQFGRPANEWSWKKVTIGTFPIEADYVFDKQMEHSDNTTAVKNRATGLSGFELEADVTDSKTVYTRIWMNGLLVKADNDKNWLGKDGKTDAMSVDDICDLTDNGTIVEVYVDDDIADFIRDVVVVQTQLMEIRRVGSDYVSLQMYDNGNSDDFGKAVFEGYNNNAINERVENVQAEDDMYSLLSGLKAGDIVAVIPVTDDGATWEVADAYVPETVSGAITGVTDYGKTNTTRHTVSVTVGGTTYNVAVWNKKLHDVTADVIKATKKDVTLYLDRNGNAMLAKDIGATNDWMVVGNFRQSLENGRIINIVNGWDISGTAVELNVGTVDYYSQGIRPGDLVKYSSTTSNTAEWRIDGTTSGDVYAVSTANNYEIKSSNTRVNLVKGSTGSELVTYDKSVKFIYVNFNEDDNEVESIEVKTVRQNVTNDELATTYKNKDDAWDPAQACVKDNAVKAVVIKSESNDAIASNMLYVRDYYGSAAYDSTNKMVYGYRVAMNTTSGFEDDAVIYSYDRLVRGDFASYTAVENADHSEFYTLRRHNNFVNRTTSTYAAQFASIVDENNGFVRITANSYGWVNGSDGANKPVGISGIVAPYDKTNMPGLVQVSRDDLNTNTDLYAGNQENIVDVKNANFLDLRPASEKTATREIVTYDDLKAVMMNSGIVMFTMDVVMVVNDNPSNDGFRQVSMVVIQKQNVSTTDATFKAMKELTEFTFQGTDWTINNSLSTITQAVVTSDAVGGDKASSNLSWKHNGASISVKLNGETISAGTVTLTDSDTIDVVVTDRNGATRTYGQVTVVVTPKTPATYTNSTAVAEHITDASYVASQYVNVAAASGPVVTGSTLSMPLLLTGNDAKTMAQIKEALKFAGWTVADDATMEKSGTTWYINATSPAGLSRTVDIDETTYAARTLITVDGVKKIVSGSDTVDHTSVLNGASNITITPSVNDAETVDVSYLNSADSTVIKAGYSYAKNSYVLMGNLPTAASADGFDIDSVTHMVNNVATAVQAGDRLALNEVVTVTVKPSDAISNLGSGTDGDKYLNGATLTFTGATAVSVTGYAETDNDPASNTGGVVTFVRDNSVVIVPDTAAFAATYTATGTTLTIAGPVFAEANNTP